MRARGGRNCTPTASFFEFVPILMNVSDFFLIFETFFFSFERTTKSREIWICFRKRLGTTLKKFLDNRSKRFANTSQTFFDKRGLQKLDKNLKKIICIRTN